MVVAADFCRRAKMGSDESLQNNLIALATHLGRLIDLLWSNYSLKKWGKTRTKKKALQQYPISEAGYKDNGF